VAIFTKRHSNGVVWYYIRFPGPDGRRRVLQGGTKLSQARALLVDTLGEIKNGTWIDPKAPKAEPVTFEKFADRFLAEHTGRRRSDMYSDALRILKKYIGERNMVEITKADLDQLRITLQSNAIKGRKRGPTTVLKYLRIVGRVFKTARRWGVIQTNPAEDLEKPAPARGHDRFLSRKEYDKLEAAAPDWLRPMLRLSVSTGLRLGEVAALAWDDVTSRPASSASPRPRRPAPGTCPSRRPQRR
jgi:integrase